jgi:hypothetical protein
VLRLLSVSRHVGWKGECNVLVLNAHFLLSTVSICRFSVRTAKASLC